MTIQIGISPCPNDTFIFDALAQGRIDTQGLQFAFIFEDVETLNQLAAQQKLDLLKLSYANYFSVAQHYRLLRSGGAMGEGVGPLLVAREPMALENLPHLHIGIPGERTTANFLLSQALPQITHKSIFLFSEIEDAVLSGQVDAGLIIHENRFTYADKGLVRLLDLGEVWEEKTKLPIPLGGIAIRRDWPTDHQKQINQLIRQSIEFAWTQYPELSPFIISHSQAMQESVMRQHIQLYVNDYSLDPGDRGIAAVNKMASSFHHPDNLPIYIY